MRRITSGWLLTVCITAGVGFVPASATGADQAHATKNVCAELGLTSANVTKLFHQASEVSPGINSCYIGFDHSAPSFITYAYLYPVSAEAAVVKGIQKYTTSSTRLGGLGAGAEIRYYAAQDWINVTRGSYFVDLWMEFNLTPSKSIALAHFIYRGLA